MNQTSHELQVATSVSGLAVKGAFPAPAHAPGVIIAESGLTKSELNPLVRLLTPCASRFVDDQPTQHSGLGPYPNAHNLLITGGTFVSIFGGLCVNNFTIIAHRSRPRTMSIMPLLILSKCRRRSLYSKNQIPVHCLPDGKIY